MTLSDLRVLVVDINADARGRLNEVIRSVIYRVKIQSARNHREAIEYLSQGESFSVVIAGSARDNTKVLELLSVAQARTDIKTPIFIVSLKAGDQESGFVAQLYQAGVHGFICEPYTAENLSTLLTVARENGSDQVADQVKHLRSVEFLAANAARLLDKIVTGKVLGKKGYVYDVKAFKDLSTSMKDLVEKVGSDRYAQILTQKFGEMDTPTTPRLKNRVARTPKKVVVHPGAMMQQVMLERNLTAEKLLSIIKIEPAEFDALLAQQASLNEVSAREIARAMGKTAKFWLDLQAEWDKQKQEEEQARLDHSGAGV